MFAAPVVIASATCAAVQGTCCVFSSACCFGKAIAANGQKAGRVASVWVLIVGMLVALVGRTHNCGAKLALPSTYLPWTIASVNGEDCADGLDIPCSETDFVLRIGAATATFFVLHGILCQLSATFVNSFWAMKLLVYVALLGILLIVPIEALNNFILLAILKLAAIAFLTFQVLIFIEWTEGFNSSLVALDDNWALRGGRCQEWGRWRNVLLSLDIVFGGAALVGCACIVYFFHDCSARTDWLASGCFISIVGFTTIQLSDASEDQKGNLFTSTIVACYVVHLCFAAAAADPLNSPDVCPSVPPSVSSLVEPGLGVSVYLSMLFVVASVTMALELREFDSGDDTSTSSSNGSAGQQKFLHRRSLENVLTGTAADDYGAVSIENIEDGPMKDPASAPTPPPRDVAFNVLMTLASCCWTMLLCGWGSTGQFALWLNASLSWVAALLYLWTLLAPHLFPDRDFS